MLSKLISETEIEYIDHLLASNHNGSQKRALQRLCNDLERGRFLTPSDRERILHRLFKIQQSSDTKVRRWIYKLISLTQARELAGYLVHQLLFKETDDENLTWAFTALSVISTREEIEKLMRADTVSRLRVECGLAAQLYTGRNADLLPGEASLLRALDSNGLSAKWYALLYGYGRAAAIETARYPKQHLIKVLNGHDQPEVVEYSVWALHQSTTGTITDLAIDVHDYESHEANVRRWLYRLAAKDRDAWSNHSQLLFDAVDGEPDEAAREGLAIAVSPYYDTTYSRRMIEWYLSEKSDAVRDALLLQFVRHTDRDEDYEELIRRELQSQDGIRYPTTERLIMAGAAALPSTHSVRELVRRHQESRYHGQAAPVSVTNNMWGFIKMTEKRSVQIKGVGGNVNVSGAGINLGHIEKITVNEVDAITGIANQEEVKSLLLGYLAAVKNAELAAPTRGEAYDAVRDLAQAGNAGSEVERVTKARKAIRVLTSIAEEAPVVTRFVQETDRLVAAVRNLFNLS